MSGNVRNPPFTESQPGGRELIDQNDRRLRRGRRRIAFCRLKSRSRRDRGERPWLRLRGFAPFAAAEERDSPPVTLREVRDGARLGVGEFCTISRFFPWSRSSPVKSPMTAGAVDAADDGSHCGGGRLVRQSRPPPWSQRELRASSSARRGRPTTPEQPVLGENGGLRGGRRAVDPADAAIPALAARARATQLQTRAAVARAGGARALPGSWPSWRSCRSSPPAWRAASGRRSSSPERAVFDDRAVFPGGATPRNLLRAAPPSPPPTARAATRTSADALCATRPRRAILGSLRRAPVRI